MKKYGFILGSIVALFGLAFGASKKDNVPDKKISFYQANLVCGAAADIGCGTRAKPILLDFQKHEAVKEAWLNHPGTVIAVVWKDASADKSDIADAIFSKHNLPFLNLTGDDHREQLADFENGKWYKGNEVDALSMIEADRIADQLLDFLAAKVDLTDEMSVTLHDEFENYIKKEFLAIEDADVIYNLRYWKRWEKELTVLGAKHLGADMPQIQIVSDAGDCNLGSRNSCSKEDHSACCKKGEKTIGTN